MKGNDLVKEVEEEVNKEDVARFKLALRESLSRIRDCERSLINLKKSYEELRPFSLDEYMLSRTR